MDELVVASLQAFSIELRATSENVASNIRLTHFMILWHEDLLKLICYS